jgi:hypothetical protein
MLLLRKTRLLLAFFATLLMWVFHERLWLKLRPGYSMLEHLKWPTLEERRKRATVTMLYRYRIIHQVVIIPAQPYLIPRGVASTTRGHCHRYQLPYSRLQRCILSNSVMFFCVIGSHTTQAYSMIGLTSVR